MAVRLQNPPQHLILDHIVHMILPVGQSHLMLRHPVDLQSGEQLLPVGQSHLMLHHPVYLQSGEQLLPVASSKTHSILDHVVHHQHHQQPQ